MLAGWQPCSNTYTICLGSLQAGITVSDRQSLNPVNESAKNAGRPCEEVARTGLRTQHLFQHVFTKQAQSGARTFRWPAVWLQHVACVILGALQALKWSCWTEGRQGSASMACNGPVRRGQAIGA